MEVIRRQGFHRAVFVAAGVYNVLWGVWSIADPQWFFRLSGLPLSNHPAVFACLGMVISLYGVLYFQVARVPERGWPIAAVGLTGKVLGPIGMFTLVSSGRGPCPRFCCASRMTWSGGSRSHCTCATRGLHPLKARSPGRARSRNGNRRQGRCTVMRTPVPPGTAFGATVSPYRPPRSMTVR